MASSPAPTTACATPSSSPRTRRAAASGSGGPPGEGVTLKAGGAGVEPDAELDEQGYLRMNVDKGNQASGGTAASVVSDIANGIPCEEAIEADYPYVRLERTHEHPFDVTASPEGALWLLVGTDLGFESTTALYYQRIEVRLTR